MNILVVISFIIIFILIIYLFLLKRELKRINNSIDKLLLEENTFRILHREFPDKELKKMLLKINQMILYIRDKELDLAKKNNFLKKEITNITHDLRTPLSSSLGYVDLMLKTNLSEEEKERELKVIKKRLLRLEELINSYFEFSMITSNNNNIEQEQTDLVAIAQECISHYYDDFIDQDRNIIFQNEMKKCLLLSNTEMLKRIIDNLISNALKHSSSDLTIKLSEEKDKIEVLFENTIEYSNISIEHIFDEFYTSDISRTSGNTGLGLAIVKEFTEMLGGNICAKKEMDKLIIKIDFNKKQ